MDHDVEKLRELLVRTGHATPLEAAWMSDDEVRVMADSMVVAWAKLGDALRELFTPILDAANRLAVRLGFGPRP